MSKKITSIELKNLYPEKRNNCSGHFSKYAISDKALHWAEYGLLAYFNTFAMNKGECYRARKEILKDLGISPAIYNPALKTLKEHGYVVTKRCVRNNHIVYAFLLQEPAQAKAKTSKVKEKDPAHPKYKGLDRFGYGEITQDLMRSPALQYGAKCIYAYLTAKMGLSKQVNLSMEQMRRELDMSEPTINKYMSELVRYDLIDKVKIRKAGKFSAVLYFVPGAVLDATNTTCSPAAVVENLSSPFRKKTTERITTEKKATHHNKTEFPSSEEEFLPSSASPFATAVLPQSVQDKAKPTDNKSTEKDEPYSYQAMYTKAKEEIQGSLAKYGVKQTTDIPEDDIEDTVISTIAEIIQKHKNFPDTITKDYRVLRLAIRIVTGYQSIDTQKHGYRFEVAANVEDALLAMCLDNHPRKYANGLYATGPEVIKLLNGKIWAADTTPGMFFAGLLDHICQRINNKVISSLQAYLRSCIWSYLHEYKAAAITRLHATRYLQEAAAGAYDKPYESTEMSERDKAALEWFEKARQIPEYEEEEDWQVAE